MEGVGGDNNCMQNGGDPGIFHLIFTLENATGGAFFFYFHLRPPFHHLSNEGIFVHFHVVYNMFS